MAFQQVSPQNYCFVLLYLFSGYIVATWKAKLIVSFGCTKEIPRVSEAGYSSPVG